MRVLYLIALTILIGCTNKEEKESVEIKDYSHIDSAIQASKINLIKTDSVYKKSEKLISQKIKQTIGKIESLKQEIIFAKSNNVVKTIVKTDTVYIEKKKSFWGKEKISTSTKSGVDITIDSIENQQ